MRLRSFPTLLMVLAAPAWVSAGVLASGTFKSKESGIQAMGAFEVVETGGKLSLHVKSDFRVSDGPDLYFVFHPLEASKVTGGNAKTNAFRVAELKGLSGAQSFDLPADFDVAKYPSLLVHCWQYNHLYAAGTVTKTPATGLKPSAPKRGKEKMKPGRFQWTAPESRRDARGKRTYVNR